jgi:thioredoxin 1
MTQSISDKDFAKEVEQHSGLALVDFWAEWCGPCKQLLPTIEAITKELAGVVKVMKMNIDENPEIPSKLGIRSIPTLMLFKDGKHIDTKVGSAPKNSLLEWIKSHQS